MAMASSTEYETDRNILKMHSQLLQDLSEYISPKSKPVWNKFKNQMRMYIKPAVLADCTDIFEICDKLFEMDEIAYGKYNVLSEAFDAIHKDMCCHIVRKYTTKIKEAQTKYKDKGLDQMQYTEDLNRSSFQDRRVTLVRNNLQLEKVDVLACAVDKSLNLGASGKAARDLLTFGGEILQKECDEWFPSGIKFGDVIAIKGGELKCKSVYIASLPDAEIKDKAIALEATISKILSKAMEEHVTSIALPAIGTCKMHLAAEKVAKIMYHCVSNLDKGSLNEVRFVLNNRTTYKPL